MLKHLSVINYALIEKLEMDFQNGFSVITGETGAGKSILLGALGLILGKRAEVRVLSDKSKKCIVEAIFNISSYNLKSFFEKNELDYDSQSIIRREILPSGKSRAFINDTPVRLPIMKELGIRLMDIHSQHETLHLNNGVFQLKVLDDFSKLSDRLSDYKQVFLKYRATEQKLQQLIEEELKARQEQDFIQFQFDELESANLSENEQKELEQERELLSNSNLIKESLFSVEQLLNGDESGIVRMLNSALSSMKSIGQISEAYQELQQRLESAQIEINDLVYEVDRLNEEVDTSPERLTYVEERLDEIYRLQQKHRLSSVIELLDLQEDFSNRLQHFSSLGDQIDLLKLELENQYLSAKEMADFISKERKRNIEIFQKQIQETTRQLGMNEAVFQVQLFTLPKLGKLGQDEIKFLFSANKGGELLELSKTASGGEISRVMLAVKSLVAESSMMPTILFDEIDTGISGEVAGKVGDILKKMAKQHQLLAITHLPQIAGKGSSHYWVYKKSDSNSTKSNIRLLTKDERVTELAKMLSNEKVSAAALVTAKELLAFD